MSTSPPEAPAGLRGLDDMVPALAQDLAAVGAAGVLVVEASELSGIERRHGSRVHGQVMERLVHRLMDLLGDTLRSPDRMATGELGHDHVVAFFLRPRHDARFFRDELPSLVEKVQRALEEQAGRLAYPFAPGEVHFGVGATPLLHDATMRPGVLLRRARDLALEDASLRRRVHAAVRRTRFLSMLLSEEVRMVFEPIMKLEDRSVLGFEALVRGPQGTDLANPGQLFTVAAECDALFELDCLCRRMALRSACHLPEGAKLFLNCLPSAIHDPAFQADELGRLFREHGLAPTDVVFEISERESISNFALFREVCDHYADLGFGIALDDVGAGYSSLEAVSELSPDYLKVDMSFVREIDEDPARQEILKALASISTRIGAHLIAEGIETEGELECLKSLHISHGQGYLLGRGRELKPDSDLD